ncbi:MAG: hypothetical protein DWQ01_18345 [Planctomycetota bacterium]|nr:MAG: hypothetical protein DWQ01_18345 [Planctomycetota bacterium]
MLFLDLTRFVGRKGSACGIGFGYFAESSLRASGFLSEPVVAPREALSNLQNKSGDLYSLSQPPGNHP